MKIINIYKGWIINNIMDTIDIFYKRIKDEARNAKTKARLSLLKRRSRQFAKDISRNSLASKEMVKKAIGKNKEAENVIRDRIKKIK